MQRIRVLAVALATLGLCPEVLAEPRAAEAGRRPVIELEVVSLRRAVKDLAEGFGERYPNAQAYLARLHALESPLRAGDRAAAERFEALKREALLANPLLGFDGLILLDRRRGQLGLPTNHQSNSALPRTGYDNRLAVLSPVRPDGRLRTLFRPPNGEFVGEIDLDFDGERMLLTMPIGPAWHVHEVRADGMGLRQMTPAEPRDVDHFDACYLPDGRIVFASTASLTAVPCWHGRERACSLFIMNADGTGIRQLGFDQDLTLHPSVLPSGQVIYSRWDYTGPMHMYLRPLMAMNPDGTGQRAVYGSNSYWPNALFFPRGIPDAPNKVVTIISGYHGVRRKGLLAILDLSRGWREDEGVVQLIPNRPVEPVIRDHLVDHEWPKFLHPFPLSDKYFLVAARLDANSTWGIYLVDVFDNMLPLLVDPQRDFFEPIPLRPSPRPPLVPDRVDLARDDAVVYLHDVYAGAGLAGVPRGTIRRLRVGAYHFGYPGMAGPDKIGLGGPWEAMRIVGTVPIHEDGSAAFRVPANTPLSVQPLDAEGKAVQLMRSWFTAMPGEVVSCVGCHESPRETAAVRGDLAARRGPVALEPWYGPPRGFSFEREVQPVLDRYCVGCHDGSPGSAGEPIPDLRGRDEVEDYRGRPLARLGAERLHPETRDYLGGTSVRYTPAYEALLPYVRRVGIEDDVHLLVPGEYHADTSELIQMLRKGHQGVQLDSEAWDRLVTWIDLNAPCHGTWNEVAPVPEGADRRRRTLQGLYGGPAQDVEEMPARPRASVEPVRPDPPPAAAPVPELDGWPFDAAEARRRQAARGEFEKTVDLGGGVRMKLVRIPAGSFVMGDAFGTPDEQPSAVVAVPEDYWIGAFEVTNEQFARFDPRHRTGHFMQRYPGQDGPGLALDGPRQPVVRVSWRQAMDFCAWLSERTAMRFTLPTEAQWEHACRAGTASSLHYGSVGDDFSASANVADRALSRRPPQTGGLESSLTSPLVKGIDWQAPIPLDIPCDVRFDDGAVATADAGSYAPNAWGPFDMHGNAAEWTRSAYRPYPYCDDDGRNEAAIDEPRVVRGGSFRDRPRRCRSAHRLSYPDWQRVHDVGFRVAAAVSGEWSAPVAASRASDASATGTSVQDGWVRVAPPEFQGAINNPLKGFRAYKKDGYGLVERKYIKWNDIEDSADDTVERIIAYTDKITSTKGKRFEELNVKLVPRVYLDWDGSPGKQYWPSDLHAFDYDSPAFQERLRRLVAKLGQAWDDDPRIFAVQMGLIGRWGEHHSPAPTAAQRRLLAEAFQRAFQHKPVLVRHHDAEFMQAGFGIYYDTFANPSREPPAGPKDQFPWQATHVYRDIWKRAPIEGEVEYNWQKQRESAKPTETFGRTPDETMTVPAYRRYMIDKIRRYHASYLGWIDNYNASDPEVLAGAAELQEVFGYRFVLDSASYPLAV